MFGQGSRSERRKQNDERGFGKRVTDLVSDGIMGMEEASKPHHSVSLLL